MHVRQSDARGRAAFADKSVLVTGAAGSVGAALCQKIAEWGCARLGLMDHFDHGLLRAAEMTAKIAPRLMVVDLLCDIRDRERMSARVAHFQPDIVIHAAALKHVHLGERHPGECLLTNLIGARNALAAAAAAGVEQFILISSDKAAAPACVMGASKRLAELHLRGFLLERSTPTQLKAVRFGNVLGSQGSIEPRFAEQIAAGGPLQITHPDMQRYFMSSDAAVASITDVIALPQERACATTYVMDMGAPRSILALGRDMIAAVGRPIQIEFTGLRPGEKLSEQLLDDCESASPSALAHIRAVAPKSADAYVTSGEISELEHVARTMNDATVRKRVFAFLEARLGLGAGAGRAR